MIHANQRTAAVNANVSHSLARKNMLVIAQMKVSLVDDFGIRTH